MDSNNITHYYLVKTHADNITNGLLVPRREIPLHDVAPTPAHFDYMERERESIPSYATRFTLHVSDVSDLRRNVIKSDTAYLSIPHIMFEQPPGTGKYANVITLLDDVQHSMDQSSNFLYGDARVHMEKCLDELSKMRSGSIPFTLVIADPLSGSEVEQYFSDTLSGKLQIEKYNRTWDEDEEYDLHVTNNACLYGDEAIEQLVTLIKKSKSVVGLTGAGVSTESGIPAYRNVGGGGIWTEFERTDEEINNFLTKEQCRINYWKMSHAVYALIKAAAPNPSHKLFSYLSKQNKLGAIMTQNIDGLHGLAGVSHDRVIELHGSARSIYCMSCGLTLDPDTVHGWIDQGVEVPLCKCGGFLHPTTISYGMALDPKVLLKAREVVAECDLMIVMGSSLLVSPVNTLPAVCLQRRVPVALINIGETKYDAFADMLIAEKAGETAQKVLDLLEEKEER